MRLVNFTVTLNIALQGSSSTAGTVVPYQFVYGSYKSSAGVDTPDSSITITGQLASVTMLKDAQGLVTANVLSMAVSGTYDGSLTDGSQSAQRLIIARYSNAPANVDYNNVGYSGTSYSAFYTEPVNVCTLTVTETLSGASVSLPENSPVTGSSTCVVGGSHVAPLTFTWAVTNNQVSAPPVKGTQTDNQALGSSAVQWSDRTGLAATPTITTVKITVTDSASPPCTATDTKTYLSHPVAAVLGCTNPAAINYSRTANTDDGSCILRLLGCTDPNATNYNPAANSDDGSCSYIVPPPSGGGGGGGVGGGGGGGGGLGGGGGGVGSPPPPPPPPGGPPPPPPPPPPGGGGGGSVGYYPSNTTNELCADPLLIAPTGQAGARVPPNPGNPNGILYSPDPTTLPGNPGSPSTVPAPIIAGEATVMFTPDFTRTARYLEAALQSLTGAPIVSAHYMLSQSDYGNHDVAGMQRDMTEAKALGIDAFAVNLGGYLGTPYAVYAANIFQAANNAGFKLFFSLDQSGSMSDTDSVAMMKDYARDPAYLTILGRPLLSTFGGEGAYISQRDFWGRKVLGTLRLAGINPYFVPLFNNVHADGSYSTDSIGDIAEMTAGLFTGIADGRFFGNPRTSPLRPGFGPTAQNYASATKDAQLSFILSISPDYWGAKQTPGRINVEYYGGEGLEAQWRQAITTLKPFMVELFTWNDKDENTYLCNASIIDPVSAGQWPYWYHSDVAGYYKDRSGIQALNRYFITWFKTGLRPVPVVDTLYYFYRTQPRSMVASGDPAGAITDTSSIDWTVPDILCVTTDLVAPGDLEVSSGGTITHWPVAAGMQHTRIPFSAGAQTFAINRSGARVMSVAGEAIVTSAVFYNYTTTSGTVSH